MRRTNGRGGLLQAIWLCISAVAMLAVADACAEHQYGPGVSDTEIKIGQTMP